MSKILTPLERKRAYEQDYFRYNFLRIWQRRYSQMLGRAEGRSTNKSHAQGKDIMSKDDFLIWCKEFDNLDAFMSLWFVWAEHGFKLWWAPSIDRIHSDKGYTIGNIQWMGFAENCKKNNKSPIDHEDETWDEGIEI